MTKMDEKSDSLELLDFDVELPCEAPVCFGARPCDTNAELKVVIRTHCAGVKTRLVCMECYISWRDWGSYMCRTCGANSSKTPEHTWSKL